MPGPASGSIVQFYGYDDSEALQGGIIAKVLDFDKVTGLLQLVFLGAEDEYLQWWLFSPAGEGGMSSNRNSICAAVISGSVLSRTRAGLSVQCPTFMWIHSRF
jgi:hypothetical protein